MALIKALKGGFSVVRNIVLASVINEPENRKFSVLAHHYPRFFNFITLLFCLYISFLIFLIVKIIINTLAIGSFILTARTERVEYQPESIAPPRIAFYDATFQWQEASTDTFDPTSLASTESKSLAVTGKGSIQVQGKSDITFVRTGNGPMHIQIKCDNPIAVYNENEEQTANLPPAVEMVQGNLSALLQQGVSWKYNLDGPLSIGRVPTFDVQQLSGLLIEGDIQMIARQLLSGNHYKVDPYKLQMGDEIEFSPNAPKTSGLLTFDSDRGLKVMAIVEAESATVKKFRTTNIKIQNNLWSKLGKDEELVITWAILLAVPSILVFLSRLLTYHLQSKPKK